MPEHEPNERDRSSQGEGTNQPDSANQGNSAAKNLAAPPPTVPLLDRSVSIEELVEEALPPRQLHRPDGQIEHPRVRYQLTDAPLKVVVALMLISICVVAVIIGGAGWFFQNRQHAEQRAEQEPLPENPRAEPGLPLPPRLEELDRLAGNKKPNVDRRMTVRESQLDEYGPTDEAGFIHVPIDRAIDELAGHLPVRKQSTSASAHDQGLLNDGASNSGRTFERGKP